MISRQRNTCRTRDVTIISVQQIETKDPVGHQQTAARFGADVIDAIGADRRIKIGRGIALRANSPAA